MQQLYFVRSVALFHESRKEHGHWRPEGNQHQIQNHHDIERHDSLGGLLDGDLSYRTAYEESRSYRRSGQSDGQVEDHHDAELNRVHAQMAYHYRIEDRGGDDDQRSHVHDASEHQQHDVDHKQQQDPAVGDAQQPIGDRLWYAQERHQIPEGTCRCDEAHDHGQSLQRIAQDRAHLLEGNLTIDEEGDDERIDGSHCCTLGRREHTGDDASHDDEDGEQAEDGIACNLERLLPAIGGFLGVTALVGDDGGRDHEQETETHTGDQAAEEQLADGNAAACRHGEDDHVVAGGDQDAFTSAGDGDCNGKIRIVAVVDHHRDEHRSDGGYVGNRRTTDAAEEHGGKDVHLCQTTAEPSDEGVGEADQSPGNASLAHDLTREDEERNGQQGEGVHPAHQALDDRHERKVQVHGGEDGGEEQGEGDGELHDKHEDKGSDEDQRAH